MISKANKMPTTRQAAVSDLAQRLHSVCVRLLRRARRDDSAMGLPPAQASALSVLVFGGAQTLSALAGIEQVRAPTMTRIVDALERAGYARRTQDPHDRRRFSIIATNAGVRLMRAGRERRASVLADELAQLSRGERAALLAALDILERLPQKAG